jgi:hypothetical protein
VKRLVIEVVQGTVSNNLFDPASLDVPVNSTITWV